MMLDMRRIRGDDLFLVVFDSGKKGSGGLCGALCGALCCCSACRFELHELRRMIKVG